MAEAKSRLQGRIKIAQIVLSAITASGAVATLVTDDVWAGLFTTLVSVTMLVVTTYTKDVNPGAIAQKHRQAAAELWAVREDYLSILTDLRDESFSLESLRDRRDRLQATLQAIYLAAPQTDGAAYAKAQDALKNREDLTFAESELDLLLPTSLRRSGGEQT